MGELDKLKQLVEMLSTSISDIESCEEDLKYLDQDFLQRYPDLNHPDLSASEKTMLNNIKMDYLYFRRRNYVKTFFSSIEGILFAIKRMLLDYSDKLSDEEVIKLREYRLIGPNENKLSMQNLYLSTDENVKFVIRVLEKVGAKQSTKLSTNDWQGFKKSVIIRNKITHPKNSLDLLINENELNIVRHAHDWFFKVFRTLLENEV